MLKLKRTCVRPGTRRTLSQESSPTIQSHDLKALASSKLFAGMLLVRKAAEISTEDHSKVLRHQSSPRVYATVVFEALKP